MEIEKPPAVGLTVQCTGTFQWSNESQGDSDLRELLGVDQLATGQKSQATPPVNDRWPSAGRREGLATGRPD